MENRKSFDQCVEDGLKQFSSPCAFGPYFFINFAMWNVVGFVLGTILFDAYWASTVIVCIGILLTTRLSALADGEWFVERALKAGGHDVKTLHYCSDECEHE